MKTVLIAAILAIALATVNAATAIDPEAVSNQLRREGARATVDSLDRAGLMDRVLEAIGRGQARWVALAPLLAPGTDGADGEGIGIELARALPANPAGVLRVLQPGDGLIGIQRVCGVPFIESTPAFDQAYVRDAIAAVSKVSATDLATRRDECLARLGS